jgi:acetoin utilization protein AcuB
MKRLPQIKSVMTTFPFSVEAEASVSEALEFMREHTIRHLPVTDDGDVVGLVSDRDIKLMLGPDFAYPAADELKVRDAMVPDPYAVQFDARLDSVLAYMAREHVGSVVVMRHGRLVGMFTTSDACRAFAEFLRDQFRRSGGGDAA